MKKIVFPIILIFLLSSCSFMKIPVPVYGCYAFLRGSTEAEGFGCQLQLEENGNFTFVQFGGASTPVPVVMKGTFTFNMDSYTYTEMNGTLSLVPDDSALNSVETILSKGVSNEYDVYWNIDPSTGISYINMKSSNLNVCDNLYNGIEISLKEFTSNMPSDSGISDDTSNSPSGDDV